MVLCSYVPINLVLCILVCVNIMVQVCIYLDRITVVAWRHLVYDIDLCAARNCQKMHKNAYFGV